MNASQFQFKVYFLGHIHIPALREAGVPDCWPQVLCGCAPFVLSCWIIWRIKTWQHRYFLLGSTTVGAVLAQSCIAIGRVALHGPGVAAEIEDFGIHWCVAVALLLVAALCFYLDKSDSFPKQTSTQISNELGVRVGDIGAGAFVQIHNSATQQLAGAAWQSLVAPLTVLALPILSIVILVVVIQRTGTSSTSDPPMAVVSSLAGIPADFGTNPPGQYGNEGNRTASLAEARALLADRKVHVVTDSDGIVLLANTVGWWADAAGKPSDREGPDINVSITFDLSPKFLDVNELRVIGLSSKKLRFCRPREITFTLLRGGKKVGERSHRFEAGYIQTTSYDAIGDFGANIRCDKVIVGVILRKEDVLTVEPGIQRVGVALLEVAAK